MGYGIDVGRAHAINASWQGGKLAGRDELINELKDGTWRPKSWEGQPDFCGKCKEHPKSCYLCTSAFEAGATAILKRLKELAK